MHGSRLHGDAACGAQAGSALAQCAPLVPSGSIPGDVAEAARMLTPLGVAQRRASRERLGERREERMWINRLGCVALAMAVVSTGCGPRTPKPVYQVPGGDPARGNLVLETHGCVACHTIPGVKYAHGRVAPPLVDFGKRGFIGGVAPNTPDNLIKWVMNPQSLKPRTDMPNMDLTEQEARDVAAYLYTLH